MNTHIPKYATLRKLGTHKDESIFFVAVNDHAMDLIVDEEQLFTNALYRLDVVAQELKDKQQCEIVFDQTTIHPSYAFNNEQINTLNYIWSVTGSPFKLSRVNKTHLKVLNEFIAHPQ